MKPEQYQKRTYRKWVRDEHLTAFTVSVRETDLQIYAHGDLSRQAREEVVRQRGFVESYIRAAPLFMTSLTPVAVSAAAPAIVRIMAAAGEAAGVGPMAAVAGALAQCVGQALLPLSEEVIVENGGDVFIHTRDPVTVALFAGDSPLSGRVGLRLGGGDRGVGVCTSSGTVGHSLSTGRADAACVVALSCAVADALATAVGNAARGSGAIEKGLALVKNRTDIDGAVLVDGDRIGAWGQLELVQL